MTFLNQALLWGAGALLIPIVIHILNRSRFKTVEWGAMHLLDSVIKVNHKRFRLDQLILLLLRCAIPVLLALCLARPVLTGAQALEGETPVALMILLDNSYSMETQTETESRFDKAVSTAKDLVASVSRGSEINIILMGGTPTKLFNEPVFDSDVVLQRLDRVQGGMGACDVSASINEAIAELAGMSHVRRECVVLSDFQDEDWKSFQGDSAEAVRKQLMELDIVPELSMIRFGKEIEANVSVNSLNFPQRALGVGQRFNVRATIHNHGSSPVENARVILRIDGEETSVTQLQLEANSESQALFPCELKSSGSHVLTVEVEANDSLPADNQFSSAVTVWEQVKVVLVDGAPSSQPLMGETDYLSIALTPLTFGRTQLTDLIQTETIQSRELKEEHFEGTRVIVLANVSRLSDQQFQLLDDYVQSGGTLLVFGGDQLDLKWYQQNLYRDGTGMLPVPFGELMGEAGDDGPTVNVIAQRFEHPAFEFFNDPSHGDLSSATIRRWYQLSVPEENAKVIPVAFLNSGYPFIVEKTFGEGLVLQTATTCDADWSDFPLRPVYVPMMQQLITTMASRISPPRNIQTGDPVVAVLPGAESESTVTLMTPEGLQRSVKTFGDGNSQVARFEETQRPGIYTMSLPSAETFHYVASTSRSESALRLLNEESYQALAEALSATTLASSDEYLKLDRLRRYGQEVWKFALAALLAILFLELILQQRFARVGT